MAQMITEIERGIAKWDEEKTRLHEAPWKRRFFEAAEDTDFIKVFWKMVWFLRCRVFPRERCSEKRRFSNVQGNLTLRSSAEALNVKEATNTATATATATATDIATTTTTTTTAARATATAAAVTTATVTTAARFDVAVGAQYPSHPSSGVRQCQVGGDCPALTATLLRVVW